MYRQHWNFMTRSATAVFLRVGSVMLSTSSPDDCKDRPLSKHSAGKHTSLSFNRTFHCWPQSPGHHCESFLPLSERQSLVFEVGKEVKNGNKHRGDHWFDSQLEFKDPHGEKNRSVVDDDHFETAQLDVQILANNLLPEPVNVAQLQGL